MKSLRVILTAILAFTSIQVFAQKYSTKNFNYDPYIGTWEYKTDNEKFVLKTWIHTYSRNKLRVIRGVFKYVKNGFVIYDNLYMFNSFNDKESAPVSFMVIEYLSVEKNEALLSIDYTDPVTGYDTNTLPDESILKIVSTNPTKLSWHIVPCNCDYEKIALKQGEIGFTIPYDMILTKIEE